MRSLRHGAGSVKRMLMRSLRAVGPRGRARRGAELAAAGWGLQPLEDRLMMDSTVVFNEIMYHPTVDDAGGEWIELHNQMAIDMDLSRWRLAGGVDFTFPSGTLVPAGGHLVVAASPSALTGATGITNVVGPFTGALNNAGDRLRLIDNSGRLMNEVEYGDSGPWPVGADGSGASLAKTRPNDAPDEPANWTTSWQLGGTPGRNNFPIINAQPQHFDVIGFQDTWRYDDSGADFGDAWKAPGYDDSNWTGSGVATLVSYWPLNGNAAATVGTSGTLVSGPTATADRNGVAGGALAFNGISQYVNVPGGGGLNGASSGSISLWVKWNNVSQDPDCCGTFGAIIGRQSNTFFSNNILALNAATPGTASLTWRPSSAGAPPVTSSTAVGANIWRHVAVTFTASESKLYIDGVLSGTGAGGVMNDNASIPLTLGAWAPDGAGFLNGALDDVAIFSGVLSSGQVQRLAAQTLTPQGVVLVGPGMYYAGNPDINLPGAPVEIPGVTAVASSNLAGFNRNVNYLVNGAGLVGAAHSVTPDGTMWLNQGSFAGGPADLDPEVTFDLGSVKQVHSIRVWNYNEGVPNLTGRGVAQADITAAGADLIYSTIIDNQAFTQAPGAQTDFSQAFDLGVSARYIKLDNLVPFASTDNNFVGLSEVKIYTEGSPLATQLTAGRDAYYFRKSFNYNGGLDGAVGTINLAVDDGAVVYLNGVEIYRHNMPGGPVNHSTPATGAVATVTATGEIQVAIPSLTLGANVLAVEVHQASPNDGDMLFAMEFQVDVIPPTAVVLDPPLAINEVAGENDLVFQVELLNHGPEAMDLTGMILRTTAGAQYLLPAQMLAPGQYLNLTQSTLGFHPTEGDRLFLISADGEVLIDAAAIQGSARARHPDATGPFLRPTAYTPGGPNTFALQDAVVINEIMYNHRSNPAVPGTPATVASVTLLPIAATWRYNQTGTGLPIGWQTTVHPVGVGNWFSGQALLGVDTTPAAIPEPIRTAFTVGAAKRTFYFESEFTFSGSLATAQLELRHIVDDGAIFYLNGVRVLDFNMPAGVIDGNTLAASAVDNAAYSAWISIPTGSLQLGSNRLSVEVHQQATASSDVIFGAELRAITELIPAVPGTPYSENPQEWIELYNRGGSDVDLSDWRFDQGVDFVFPPGTMLGAGQYAVVARDANSLQAQYPSIAILGEYSGSLSNSGELIRLLDAVGNPADEVRYYDGGRWSAAADAGGSSLELRDPEADNSIAEAWAASDESLGSDWQTYTYRMTASPSAVGPDGQWREFILGMLEAGQVLIDDVSVIENPDSTAFQMLQNGSFETGAAGWRLLGNHSHSAVITDPDNAANKVLRIIATGETEHMHNHLETTFASGRSLVNGAVYEISFRAKWESGSNLLHSRAYFNRLAKTNVIERQDNHGTPGAPNSRLEPNIGPTYANMLHSPAVPDPGESVTVSVAAADSTGVDHLDLFYSVNGGGFASVGMTLDPDGYHRGTIPGQGASTIVQFYVRGQDGAGAVSFFPARGAQSRALYKVEDGLAANNGLHNIRIVMTPADTTLLHTETNLMSNDPIGATFIYDESEIYYDTGITLSGSQRARPYQPRLSFNLKFNEDQLFRGVHSSIVLDRSESTFFGQREALADIAMTHAGGGLAGEYNDLVQIIAPLLAHTGTSQLKMARYGNVYLDSQYENGSEGYLFEYELVYFPTSNVVPGNVETLKLPQPDDVRGTAVTSLGANPESYRWNFQLKNNRDENNFAPIMQMLSVFAQSGAGFINMLPTVIDVDQWMRSFALESAWGHGDNYGAGSAHNAQFYQRPSDGKFLYFTHDLDAFPDVNRAMVANNDLSRMIAGSPAFARLFYGHLHDILSTTFNAAHMSHWTTTMGQLLPAQLFASHLSFINTRSNSLLSQINSLVAPIAFNITTNGGADFVTASTAATLAGTGWVNVRSIRLAGSDLDLPVTWTANNQWQVSLPVSFGANPITLQAYDFQGNLISTDSITITSTSTDRPQQQFLRITELNYHPSDPSAAEISAGFLDADDFEYVELMNTGSVALGLAGASFITGISFDFDAATVSILSPGQRVLIAANPAALTARYGPGLPVVGTYQGQLDNGGEQITLLDRDGAVVHDFTYDDSGAWPGRADGSGSSLQVRSTDGDYSNQANWRSSISYFGSPGAEDASATPDVIINELVTRSSVSIVDAIELYNTTASPIDISGWWLSDSSGRYAKFQVPGGTILGSHEYIVFDESDFNPTPLTPGPNDFAFNGPEGEEAWLLRGAIGNPRPLSFADSADFGGSEIDVSFGRVPNGDPAGALFPNAGRTLGAPNAGPKFGPVVISEVKALDPVNVLSNDLEYIELFNPTAVAVDMGGWRIRGDADYNIPVGTILPALGTLVILSFNPALPANAAKVAAFASHYGVTVDGRFVGGFSGNLSNDGGRLSLRRPDVAPPDDPEFIPNVLVDEVDYLTIAPWPDAAGGAAIHRLTPKLYGNFSVNWLSQPATPGIAHGDVNQDGLMNAADIDALFAHRAPHPDSPLARYDLDGSGVTDNADANLLILDIFCTYYGDSNLDGRVSIGDLTLLAEHFGETSGAGWATGDFNGDQAVSIGDLTLLAENFGLPAALIGQELTGSAADEDASADGQAPAGLQALGDGAASADDESDEEEDGIVDILADLGDDLR